MLQEQLRALAGEEADVGPSTTFGQKYIVAGTIQGTTGRAAQVVAVWMILTGEDFPRFVTAYPGAKR